MFERFLALVATVLLPRRSRGIYLEIWQGDWHSKTKKSFWQQLWFALEVLRMALVLRWQSLPVAMRAVLIAAGLLGGFLFARGVHEQINHLYFALCCLLAAKSSDLRTKGLKFALEVTAGLQFVLWMLEEAAFGLFAFTRSNSFQAAGPSSFEMNLLVAFAILTTLIGLVLIASWAHVIVNLELPLDVRLATTGLMVAAITAHLGYLVYLRLSPLMPGEFVAKTHEKMQQVGVASIMALGLTLVGVILLRALANSRSRRQAV